MRPHNQTVHPILTVIRLLLAAVFILSGFLKAVDPWGTALKTAEYFHAFGMGWMEGSQYVLSILQSAVELWLGFLLLFRLARRTAPLVAMAFLIFFTGLTLYIALTDPVSDCGCFGDAIKLTNWQTFAKNLILLPLSVVLYLHARRQPNPARVSKLVLSVILLLFALLPGLSSLRTLPWIDFLPYRVGTNIPRKMSIPPGESQGEYKTTLIYRNLETGEDREFEITDTTWYDSARWEFVDTRTETVEEAFTPEITDFRIFGEQGDLTAELLEEEELFVFVVDDLDRLAPADGRKIAQAAEFAERNGIRTVCLTTSPPEKAARVEQLSGYPIPCLNMDGTTMKMFLRAHKGLVILQRGTILAKMNLRTVPDMSRADDPSAVAYVVRTTHNSLRNILISIYAIVILGLLVSRYRCKKPY